MTNRRTLTVGVVAGAAGLALAAGIGTRWFRSGANGVGSGVDVWPLRFATPTGAEIAMASFKGRPLLLNFWATWCPPCVGELPLLDKFSRDQAAAGWQVVGLAVDNLAPVVSFLAKRPVSFPVGLAGAAGATLSRQLGNPNGSLPFSVVFDAEGKAVAHKLGAIHPGDLAGWIEALR